MRRCDHGHLYNCVYLYLNSLNLNVLDGLLVFLFVSINLLVNLLSTKNLGELNWQAEDLGTKKQCFFFFFQETFIYLKEKVTE